MATLQQQIAQKQENAQKIILGGMVLSVARNNPQFAQNLLSMINQAVIGIQTKNFLRVLLSNYNKLLVRETNNNNAKKSLINRLKILNQSSSKKDGLLMKTKFEQSNTWQHARKIEIKKIIDNDNFPCIFGKKASKNNTIQWLLCESSDNQKNFFLQGVMDYTNFIKATLPEERLLYPLIAVIQSNAKSLKEQHEIAWEFIQYLTEVTHRS